MSKADYFKELAYRLRGLPERERNNIISVYEELFQKAMENGKQEEEVARSLGYPRVPNWDNVRERSGYDEPAQPEDSLAREYAPVPGYAPAPDYEPLQPPPVSGHARPEAGPPNKAAGASAYEQATYTAGQTPPYYPQRPQHHGYPPPPYDYPYPAKRESGGKAIIVSIALGFFNLLFVVGPFFGLVGALLGLFVGGVAMLLAPLAAVAAGWWMNPADDLRLLFFSMLACFGLGILLTSFSVWLIKGFGKLTWKYVQFNVKLIRGV
ncbi:DUF1700 domain-containing protein [Paenibacillus athensensis]|uniref:DUF1700 domain-containing protein n=1 Tax=Paenibacillus athensensis TaxID=1967502 RepID=A0A4Y8Q6S0_9BACL|nr:DUF1700 domain-containing protein [Paenibacillus athensensis]MCD1260810.1 DUF1700 domain-containing protein [Paenibacillus athensensis]